MSWRNSDSADFSWGSEFKYTDWECPVKVGDSYELAMNVWDCFKGVSSNFFTVRSGVITEITKNKDNSYEAVIEGTEFYTRCDAEGKIIDLKEATRGTQPWKTFIGLNPDNWEDKKVNFIID